MSEVRYTPDGTYDASHSKVLDTSDAGSPLDSVFLYDDGVGGDALRVSGPDGEIIFHKVDMSRDGIYVDLSDNAHAVYIEGGNGGDVLIGSAFTDIILAGGFGGPNSITGGGGGDKLIAGSGSADTFVYLRSSDSAPKDKYSLDEIVNFNSEDHDQIDVSAIADFDFIGKSRFHANGIAEVRLHYGGRATMVLADVDGDGRIDLQIRMSHRPKLTAADFVLNHADTPSPADGSSSADIFAHRAFAEPLHNMLHLALV